MLGGDPMFSMQQFTGEAIEPQKEKKETTEVKKTISHRWHCPKCGCSRYDSTSFVNQTGVFNRNYSASTSEFISVICSECGFTELYKADKFNG